MYEYQKNSRYFAQASEGTTELAAREIAALGGDNIIPEMGGIHFTADRKALYRINYSARLISKILAPLKSFNCSSADQLYNNARDINWADFISEGKTFAIFSTVSKSSITNSHYASLRLKDSIVDSCRERSDQRPDVDKTNPDVWLNLHIKNDKATISLDTSGGSLHRRGYRKDKVTAPMQETVAAAIIEYTEWDGEVPLYDPMCGSGTLLCEALMHYCRIPAGIFRARFGFERLPDYDESLWRNVKNDTDLQIRDLPEGLIAGSDISQDAVKIASTNLMNFFHGEKVKINVADLRKIKRLNNHVIVTNPPYGIRMGNRQKLSSFYRSLGDFLKQKCRGSTAYVYFGEREFIKSVGLKAAWEKPLKTGGLDGRLVKYEIY